jgi:hypothetical protein
MTILVSEEFGCLVQLFATTPRGSSYFDTVNDAPPCINEVNTAHYTIVPSHGSSA